MTTTMSSTTTTTTTNGEGGGGEEGRDLISELPDPILHCILSYLDMTSVFQTCFLSKRWKYLWATLPFLNFNQDVYDSCPTSVENGFIFFVDRVLIFRNQSSEIQSFRFSHVTSDHGYNIESHVCTWVHILIRSNVQLIDIQIESKHIADLNSIRLPVSLFTCKSLSTLKLDFGEALGNVFFKIPPLICLPALKTLHLKSLQLKNSVELLISRSPVLETLTIIQCTGIQEFNICNPQLKSLTIKRPFFSSDEIKANVANFKICLPALKILHLESLALKDTVELLISRSPVLETLNILNCAGNREFNICNPQLNSLTIKRVLFTEAEPCEIKVSAPNLTWFGYTDKIGFTSLLYSFVNVSSLVYAEIDTVRDSVSGDVVNVTYVDPAVTRKNVINCLRGICNVRCLALSAALLLELVTEVPPERLESLLIKPFCNLRYLRLKTSLDKQQIDAIMYLLKRCPNLQYLVLKVADSRNPNHVTQAECWEAKLAPQCMMHHLELVQISDVLGSVNELEFLKFREFHEKVISFRGASPIIFSVKRK